jgi:fatty acid desaturase
MTRPDKQRLLVNHQVPWIHVWIWLSFLLVFVCLQGLLLVVMQHGLWWLVLPIVLVLAHLMHAHLLALHDAAHGTMCPNYFLNEAVGIFIGTLALIEFSLFRVVHHSHHSYMGTPRDEELWPFVNPEVSVGQRRLCAVFELGAGLFYTPFLLLRSFLRSDSPIRNSALRRRIKAELALMVVVWGAILGVTAYLHWWVYLFFLYVCPAYLAGMMQSLRKFVEHMGLMGRKVLDCTRTVVPRTRLGRFLVWTMFHEPYHGVHHKLPRLPHTALPEHSAMLEPTIGDEIPPFPTYRSALLDMLPTLRNPRIGAQWHTLEKPSMGTVPASPTNSKSEIRNPKQTRNSESQTEPRR